MEKINKYLENGKYDFHIMSGDLLVATFTNDNLTIIDTDRCPLSLKYKGDFYSFIKERAIDGSRHNARSLKRQFYLNSYENEFTTSLQMNGATITDNFWIKDADSTLSYKDILFKKNDFFKAALDIDITLIEKKPSRTPEFTNIGSQEKGWQLENGEWWLYKNEKRDDIEAEQLTYEIGKLMGYDMAEYQIVGDCEYIKTKDFTCGKYNLQHAKSIVGENEDFNYNFSAFEKLDKKLTEKYIDILVLDTLCGNVDRHHENYGILTDRNTGAIIGFAPNYDNNESFGAYRDIKNYSLENGIEEKLLRELALTQNIVINLPYLDKEKAKDIIKKNVKYSKDNADDVMKFLFERYDYLSKQPYMDISKKRGFRKDNQMPELGKTDEGRKMSQAEELAKSSQSKDKE